MEGIFNYLKPYFVKDDACLYDLQLDINLIVGTKYLLVYRCDNYIQINVGAILCFFGYLQEYCNYISCDGVSKFIHTYFNTNYYELVPDFNLSYCFDIIQTFYSFRNISSHASNYCVYSHPSAHYIYVTKINNYIIITNLCNINLVGCFIDNYNNLKISRNNIIKTTHTCNLKKCFIANNDNLNYNNSYKLNYH